MSTCVDQAKTKKNDDTIVMKYILYRKKNRERPEKQFESNHMPYEAYCATASYGEGGGTVFGGKFPKSVPYSIFHQWA
jgi:hypothetical protein